MSANSLHESKKLVRKKMLTILGQIDPIEQEKKAQEISKKSYNLISKEFYSLKKIGLYSPIAGEVNITRDFLSLLTEVTTYFPSFMGENEMCFKASFHSELVEEEYFGRKFLVPKMSGEIAVPELCLIPGLGFSQEGARIGRGKGFYDRYLANNINITKIGICFHEQLVSSIPCEETDIKMDYIITDKTVVKI